MNIAINLLYYITERNKVPVEDIISYNMRIAAMQCNTILCKSSPSFQKGPTYKNLICTGPCNAFSKIDDL